MKDNESKYFKRNMFAVFCGSVGIQGMYVFVTNYSLMFFTNFLGISAGIAGFILMASKIWDGINDPMFGVIIDKSHFKWGKTQPFVFWGGIITAIALALLFTVPSFGTAGRTAWAAIWYNIVGMAFTAATLAVTLQTSRGSSHASERVNFSGIHVLGCSVCGVIMAALSTRIVQAFANTNPEKGYFYAAVVSAVIGLVFVIANIFTFKDCALEEEQQSQVPKAKTAEMLKAVISSKYFLILVLAFVISNLGQNVSLSGILYYINYVLEKPELTTLFLPMNYIIMTLVGVLGSSGVFSKFPKKTLTYISLFLMTAGYLIKIINTGVIAFFVGTALSAAGNSLLLLAYLPMLLDCADYAEYKTGVNCQALILSGQSLFSKIGMGLATAIFGCIIQAGGFDGTSAVQSATAITSIRAASLYAPLPFFLIGMLMLFAYKLNEKDMQTIREKLSRRKEENSSNTYQN